MKQYTSLFFILICFSILSCINDKQPVYEDTAGTPGPGKEDTTITIYGYGYFRGKSKTAVHRFAIQRAKISIAEQIKGSVFTYRKNKNEVLFTSDTGEVEIGGIRTVAEKAWQRDGEWEMYVIQKADVIMELPAGIDVHVREFTAGDKDNTFLLPELKREAVIEALKAEKELSGAETVTGHIYLSSLDIESVPGTSMISIQGAFKILFD